MQSDILIATPLWWPSGDARLHNFEREVTLEETERVLLKSWSGPRTVAEVIASTGLPAAVVEAGATQLLREGILVRMVEAKDQTPAIEIEITAACQAKCSFCPREVIKKSRGFGHMTREVFRDVLESTSGRDVPAFCFCGIGEPLLHPHFLEFTRAVRNRNPQAKLFCYSNGWDLSGTCRPGAPRVANRNARGVSARLQSGRTQSPHAVARGHRCARRNRSPVGGGACGTSAPRDPCRAGGASRLATRRETRVMVRGTEHRIRFVDRVEPWGQRCHRGPACAVGERQPGLLLPFCEHDFRRLSRECLSVLL